ncbi:MAG: hypothetical protein ABW133_01660, partial [Polyangiaceae bacterium]
MSSLVLAGQIWDSQGNVRERLTVAPHSGGPLPGVLDGVMVSLKPHLAKALGGAAFTLQKESQGHTLLCQLVPLRNATGAVTGVLGLITDVSERSRIEGRLRTRVAFEKQIAELSSQFINLAPGDVDRAINDGLFAIGALARVDRAYVFLYSEDGASMSNTHEWCAPGIEPRIDSLGELSVSVLP